MSIRGLTHDTNGIINQSMKYKGKLSTGYAPNEGPNKEKYPVAAGFFRFLKEVTINDRIGAQAVTRKEWKLNEELQKKLEASLNHTVTPRKVDFICLFADPSQLWQSNLAMYSGTDGLLCRSNGVGTVAKQLKIDGDKRTWVDRECLYKECPDFKADSCKEIGIMKIFPLLDVSTDPYRFETRSIYTILGIEASLDKIWNLCKAAHVVKKIEAKKDIPFEGLFGLTFSLIHKKAKGGGRNIFITEIRPTPETSDAIMGPLMRGVKMNQTAALTAGSSSVSLLNANVDDIQMIDGPKDGPADSMDLDDERSIASQFVADANKTEPDDAALNEAASTLLDK